jgi:hypothetical protein
MTRREDRSKILQTQSPLIGESLDAEGPQKQIPRPNVRLFGVRVAALLYVTISIYCISVGDDTREDIRCAIVRIYIPILSPVPLDFRLSRSYASRDPATDRTLSMNRS